WSEPPEPNMSESCPAFLTSLASRQLLCCRPRKRPKPHANSSSSLAPHEPLRCCERLSPSLRTPKDKISRLARVRARTVASMIWEGGNALRSLSPRASLFRLPEAPRKASMGDSATIPEVMLFTDLRKWIEPKVARPLVYVHRLRWTER